MSVNQVPETPDDALVHNRVHRWLFTELAQLQPWLHGHLPGIAPGHAAPLQDLADVGTLALCDPPRVVEQALDRSF